MFDWGLDRPRAGRYELALTTLQLNPSTSAFEGTEGIAVFRLILNNSNELMHKYQRFR